MPTNVAMVSVCHCCHANQCGHDVCLSLLSCQPVWDGVLQLCDVQLNELNKMIHEASLQHCVNYLRKQIVLGFKDFDLTYPNAVFGLKG
ncbi:hypothetical protein NP493_871g00052 [Ridgeia piscesae]|uniref:Uncharacterized protein n=1 Tax=Ridgeia piscesae TaxID=27915 RepID=A0AAD9NM75_RIDPI|nr:hypothetical protein NP493_871g00052 [Ridgeia piscesae]